MPQAHTNFRWPVTVEQTIDAPAQAVWEAISMPGNLELCHPFCARNIVHTWPGRNARDEIQYLSGIIYQRHFSAWFDGVGYDLEIRQRDDDIASVSWRISATDDRSCALQITVYPQLLQDVPLVFRWFPHALRLRPMLRAYLESVTKGFEWYVTRGEPVPREHFGKHRWFS
ncbi:MAG: hypothetical protein OEM60_08200, partial [Gammaproteobacteria bacterium]|nr:hypothetical protein [Gammaproteobacteria bacterium]